MHFAPVLLLAQADEADDLDDWGDFSFDDDSTEESAVFEPEDDEVIPEGIGAVGGQIFDLETAEVIEGVTVTLEWPEAEARELANEDPRQLTVVSDAQGVFGFSEVPSGRYVLSFFKTGYEILNISSVKVYPDDTTRADAAMKPREVGFDDDIFDIGEFAVEFQSLDSTRDLLDELKQQSPGTIDFLTAEDFAKFGGSDLSSVISRLPGITVVEGQFAVVRGLGDRYNSTLVNGLPLPSPDPVRQGLQLDLFPTSIIESVVTQKQFLPNLPSNSSGAAFALQTKKYSEEPTAFFKAGVRFNSTAWDNYLQSPTASYGDYMADGASARPGPTSSLGGLSSNVIAQQAEAPVGLTFGAGASGTYENDYGGKLGFTFAVSYNSDYATEKGFQHDQFARTSQLNAVFDIYSGTPGSLFNNFLGATDFTYDLTRSDAAVGIGILSGLGYEFDDEGKNRVDFSFLLSQSGNDFVQRLDNSNLQGSGILDVAPGNGSSDNSISRNFNGRNGNNQLRFNTDTISYEQRELYSYMLTGEHEFDGVEGMKVDWGAVVSTTTSDTPYQTVANYVSNVSTNEFSYYGSDFMNNTPNILSATWRNIEEEQYGARADFDYEFEAEDADWLSGVLESGIYWSQAERSTNQLDTTVSIGDPSAQIFSDSAQGLINDVLNGAGTSEAASVSSFAETSRQVIAGYIGTTINLTESIRISGGARLGNLKLTSTGDPDGGLNANATVVNVLAARTQGNSEIRNSDLIGYPTQNTTDDQARAIVREQITEGGNINDLFILPAVALDFEVMENVTLKAGYSQTLAQPSFRELSPYFSRELSTGEVVLGNVLLQTSKVESFDLGLEYRPWEGGLLGVGAFYKTIENPIEQIALFDSGTQTSFLTYFNNPNPAQLRGVELQFETSLGVLGDELENFSFGTNFAYIDARVGYPDSIRETYFNTRSQGTFFETTNSPFGAAVGQQFATRNVPTVRRLFDQPEYIVNANITYDNPDWGTAMTISVFAQSEVLTTVGSGSQFTVDQFTADFYSLDFTWRQDLVENLQLQFRVTNLTDTPRGIIYDQSIVNGSVSRQSVKIGQTYRIALNYVF